MKNLITARNWRPPDHWERFTVIDSHAGGEPFRIVIEGLPSIGGQSVIEMRNNALENLDRYRKILTWEPRGHADMYGGWIGPPTRPDSDLSVLFVHNEGFSTMCGHGIIALGKVLVDTGFVEAHEPSTRLTIDTPAGQVRAEVDFEDGKAGTVTFRNVGSFVVELDSRVKVPDLGTVVFDLAFGGAFYAYVKASSLGLDLDDASSLIEAGRKIKRAISSDREISHPLDSALSFLYGVVFTGPPVQPSSRHRSVCIFAEGELDRSPTGTGVSGSIAILVERSELSIGETIAVESILGSVFEGKAVARAEIGGIPAVIPEISGTAHLIGRSEFWVDPDDPLGDGFFLR